MIPRTGGINITIIYFLTVIFGFAVIEDSCGWSTTRTTSFTKSRHLDYDSLSYFFRNTRRYNQYYSITSALESYQITTPIIIPKISSSLSSSSSDRNATEICIDWMNLNNRQQFHEDSNITFNDGYYAINSNNTNRVCPISSDALDKDDSQQHFKQQFTYTHMPLYPLPSVTVPDVTNHNVTFWNVERRNIRMVLDLEEKAMITPQFDQLMCVVLQAKDTGRIASIGTVVRILHIEKELRHDNTLSDVHTGRTTNYRRIIVTCVPVGIANKIDVINPIASTREHRFRYPDEYLIAAIQYRNISNFKEDMMMNDESMMSICSQIQSNLHIVFLLYRTNRIVTHNWPPVMISRIQSMADFDDSGVLVGLNSLTSDSQIFTSTEFWTIVQLWQSLCETVRAVHEMMMISERNEFMVDAAIRNSLGGPLQLPVHMEDLLPSQRRNIEQRESAAQQQWVQLQLDPCIDFQILLSLQKDNDRYYYLSQMIVRERRRLEDVIRSAKNPDSDTTITSSVDNENPVIEVNEATVRKGAWFNDEYW